MFSASAWADPAKSTCTEWSTTRSTGTSGSMIFGSPLSRATAARMAARSTSSGTPVKSCKTMRATTKGISSLIGFFAFQFARLRTSSSLTFFPSQFRKTDSSTMRMECGSREIGPTPAASNAGRLWNEPVRPSPRSRVWRVWKLLSIRGTGKLAKVVPGCNREVHGMHGEREFAAVSLLPGQASVPSRSTMASKSGSLRASSFTSMCWMTPSLSMTKAARLATPPMGRLSCGRNES